MHIFTTCNVLVAAHSREARVCNTSGSQPLRPSCAHAALNAVRRCMKDTEYTKKEIATQRERIKATEDNPEKDEHDVKKQVEVLQEYLDTVPREHDALFDHYGKLEEFVAVKIEEASEDSEDAKKMLATDEFGLAKAALEAARSKLIECGKLDKEEEEDMEEDPEV